MSWLGKMAKLLFIFLFFSFLLSWTYYTEGSAEKCYITSVTVTWQEVTMSCCVTSHDGSHDEYGKIMHRPYSSCISSIQEINKDFIKFFLSTQIRSRIKCSPLSLTFSLLTQTWSRLKLSWLKSYIYTLFITNFIWTYLY